MMHFPDYQRAHKRLLHPLSACIFQVECLGMVTRLPSILPEGGLHFFVNVSLADGVKGKGHEQAHLHPVSQFHTGDLSILSSL